jgi:hypothetical protein
LLSSHIICLVGWSLTLLVSKINNNSTFES